MSIPTDKERRVMSILRKAQKPMSHADLMRAANVSDWVVREALGKLHDRGELDMANDGGGSIGYYGQYFKPVYSVKEAA